MMTKKGSGTTPEPYFECLSRSACCAVAPCSTAIGAALPLCRDRLFGQTRRRENTVIVGVLDVWRGRIRPGWCLLLCFGSAFDRWLRDRHHDGLCGRLLFRFVLLGSVSIGAGGRRPRSTPSNLATTGLGLWSNPAPVATSTPTPTSPPSTAFPATMALSSETIVSTKMLSVWPASVNSAVKLSRRPIRMVQGVVQLVPRVVLTIAPGGSDRN